MEKMVSISLWKKNWKERKVTRYNSIMKTKILFTHEDVANIAEQGRKMGKIDTNRQRPWKDPVSILEWFTNTLLDSAGVQLNGAQREKMAHEI